MTEPPIGRPGVGRAASGRTEVGRPVPLRTEVRRVSWLTPRTRRLVLGGGDLGQFRWSGAASHLKLILPGPGLGPEVLPPAGDLQPVRLDRATMTVRTYTPRAWEPTTEELVIDVVVHGAGPASAWAAAAQPGAPLAVTSPLGRYDVDADTDWLVLAGDETAVPAIATILEIVPAGRPTAVLAEVGGDDDRIDLGESATTTIRWLHRQGSPGAMLAQALSDIGTRVGVSTADTGTRVGVSAADTGARVGVSTAHTGTRVGVTTTADESTMAGVGTMAGTGQVWVGCESKAMLEIRRQLLEVQGLPRRSVTTRGYWTAGRGEGTPAEDRPATSGQPRA